MNHHYFYKTVRYSLDKNEHIIVKMKILILVKYILLKITQRLRVKMELLTFRVCSHIQMSMIYGILSKEKDMWWIEQYHNLVPNESKLPMH